MPDHCHAALAGDSRADSRPPEQDRRDWIDAELVELLHTQSVAPMLVGLMLTLAIAAAMHALAPALTLAWVAVRLATASVRLLVSAARRTSATPNRRFWWRLYMALLALDGASWGMIGVGMPPVTAHPEVMMVLAMELGVSSYGIAILQTRGANLWFSLPLLLPCALAQFGFADPVSIAIGCGQLLFIGFVALSSRRWEWRAREFLGLRYDADSLARQRAEALDLARENADAKDRLLAIMSHEIRTPLHGILGLTRQLQAGAGLEAGRGESLRLIESAGEHLLMLINDVLDHAKLAAGRIEVAQDNFDLVALLNEPVRLLQPLARERGLRLALDAAALDTRCLVIGDAARLRQVVTNLISNALKFTLQGGIDVVVRREAETTRIDVVDSGVGIQAGDVETVFAPFRQIDGAAQRRFKGTGLGLSISRDLARCMGGDLVCTSRFGSGSTFSLSLCLPLATAASAVPVRDLAEPPVLHGLVLLAEDNEVNALVARTVMEAAGVHVEVVDDGARAVSGWVDSRPDLVLMDCRMPGMDGFEASRRIRDLERETGRARVPIVALTGDAGDADRDRCLEAGMDGVLCKPFRREDLLLLLTHHLPA